MCSSPKSNMTARAPKQIIRGVLEEMSSEQRKRFAEKANKADDLRSQRLETDARWHKKHTSKSRKQGFGEWLNNLFSF